MIERTDPDLLSGILTSYELEAKIYATPSVCGAWQLGGKGEQDSCATFHLLGRGHGWLHMGDKQAPIALRSGDLVLFPRDNQHIIASSPEIPPVEQVNAEISASEGPATNMVYWSPKSLRTGVTKRELTIVTLLTTLYCGTTGNVAIIHLS